MMDEARLIDKPRSIEALFAGATTAGEKVAAEPTSYVKRRAGEFHGEATQDWGFERFDEEQAQETKASLRF